MIQYVITNFNNNMQGMNNTFSNSVPSPFKYAYAVPAIPDGCAGVSLSNVTAAFYTGALLDTLRSDKYYTGTTQNIILNQCKQFGAVSNYTNYDVDLGYDVITNPSTKCYYRTCNNYAANEVGIIYSPGMYGVRLMDDSGISKDYLCRTDIQDSVCPDDFEYAGGTCRQGVLKGGICASYGVKDADCEARTPMKCGNITLSNGTIAKTCIVPLIGSPPSPPATYCSNTLSCVYANETTGVNPKCYNLSNATVNDLGWDITCSYSNTWCPRGYYFNATLNRCVDPSSKCDSECSSVRELLKLDTQQIKTTNIWSLYLNNAACFQTDLSTGRRAQYCGLKSAIPENVFVYLNVGVVSYFYDTLTSKFMKSSDYVLPDINYTADLLLTQ
jgi:hypothetical protein